MSLHKAKVTTCSTCLVYSTKNYCCVSSTKHYRGMVASTIGGRFYDPHMLTLVQNAEGHHVMEQAYYKRYIYIMVQSKIQRSSSTLPLRNCSSPYL